MFQMAALRVYEERLSPRSVGSSPALARPALARGRGRGPRQGMAMAAIGRVDEARLGSPSFCESLFPSRRFEAPRSQAGAVGALKPVLREQGV